MFGGALSVPMPDVDRTDYLLMLGANPLASNGSLMTAPDMPGRLQAMRARGGKLVVVDPRRTRTARGGRRAPLIRPGTDALLPVRRWCTRLFAEGLVGSGALGRHVERRSTRCKHAAPAVRARGRGRRAAASTAATIRRLARELAAAPTRRRLRPHRHLHAGVRHAGELAGRRAQRPHRQPRPAGRRDVHRSRRRRAEHAGHAAGAGGASLRPPAPAACAGCPRSIGEFPVGAAWPRRSRRPATARSAALITVAGNPVLSHARTATASHARSPTLDFMVSVDIYLNETTRHADVDPAAGPSPLAQSHYDVALSPARASATSPTTRRRSSTAEPGAVPSGRRCCDWPLIVSGQGLRRRRRRRSTTSSPSRASSARSPVARLATSRRATPTSILAALGAARGPERILDLMLRTGPYGDGFGAEPDGLTLAALEANPHGIDLGPLAAAHARGAAHAERARSSWPPSRCVADVERLLRRARTVAGDAGALVLVGRRDLRSNNSWMHNLAGAGEGQAALHGARPPRRRRPGCGLSDGARRRVSSRAGSDRGARRGHRRGHARRRQHPARLGPRRRRTRGWRSPRAHAGANCNLLARTRSRSTRSRATRC